MTELDKKIQKNQPDLVQSVTEAFEKRNVERVDVLISNAFKQLKMSRFKPDQATCIGLIYLARTCPKVFSQSNNMKEMLKTHIKRDSGPSTIKGSKNDFILPVLAANILLASCDCPDVRSVILTRIEQWISSNQKLNELVQHILAVLCVRCHDDTETVKTLIDMRQHWFQFIDSNFDTYGPVSQNLSISIRNLLNNETSCESLVDNLLFLIRHDSDIEGLSAAISKLIIQKPITIESMLKSPEFGDQLYQLFSSIYAKLLQSQMKKADSKELIYFKFPSLQHIIPIDRTTTEAILTLLTSDSASKEEPVIRDFIERWLSALKSGATPVVFEDASMSITYQLPTRLLEKLVHSDKDHLIELGILSATASKLIELALQFGLATSTIRGIFARLESMEIHDNIRAEVKNLSYSIPLLQYFSDIGVEGADDLKNRLDDIELTQDDKKVDPPEVKIKMEIA